jgi:hypothetical protein
MSALKDHIFILCVFGANEKEYQYHIFTTIVQLRSTAHNFTIPFKTGRRKIVASHVKT